jgi:terminase, large subunit
VSTPTVKGISRIEASFEESDQRHYFVPCPHCGEMQMLEFGGEGCDYGIKFTRDEAGAVRDVWYECSHCHKRIDEHYKTEMLARGEWRATYPERRKRGYQISSLYSPLGWVSWRQIVEEFLKAKDNRERLKVWTNTRLGLPFEEKGDQPDWVILQVRSEPYEILTVPERGLLLTAGVDVQADRLAVVIRAWGRGEESWLVYWCEIYGNPGEARGVWDELDLLLNRTYPHDGGSELSIVSLAVDSGFHTQAVYNYARGRSPKVAAVKGQAVSGKPVIGRPSHVDIAWQGVKIPNGVQLWPVGSDTAKGTIYARLRQEVPGPGYYHFPIGLDEEYFRQLTAEKLVTRYVKGYPRLEWVKIGPRNEALDCEVYAYAAAIRAGLGRIDWDGLERTIRGGSPAGHERQPVRPTSTLPPRGSWLDQGYRRGAWFNER